MTTLYAPPSVVASERAADSKPGPTRRGRFRFSEELVFGVSVGILVIHMVDRAVRGEDILGHPGSSLTSLLAFLLVLATVAAFLQTGRLVRILLAAAIGLTAIFVGFGVPVSHILMAGPSGADYSGALAALAGLVLLGLAIWLGIQGRRRLVQIAATLLIVFVILQWLVDPVLYTGSHTQEPRVAVPSASTLGIPGATDVTFPTRDGSLLSGWYVPGTNGATVILLHGSSGTRTFTTSHLRMLVQAGYGMLAYDLPGHGQSEGRPNSLGWRAADDLGAAVDFLRQRPDVDPSRIGALGLSLGAVEALRATAEGVPLAAIVADGVGACTVGDYAAVEHRIQAPIALSTEWVGEQAAALFSGDAPPVSLVGIVDHIHVPVLLIATNYALDPGPGHPPEELELSQIYADRIGDNASLWYVDDASHTRALEVRPQEYAARVSAFLNAALSDTDH